MKKHRLVTGLCGLALLTSCSRAPTLLVTVENVPATAFSLQLSATHAGLAAIVNLDPLELPQPTQNTSTFLLRLPANFTGDVGVSVAAFKNPGGGGCLLATGTNTTPMFAGPDETLRVPLMPASDTACTGNPVLLTSVSQPLGNINGNETITLTGWGFKPGAKVTFGTTAARSVTYVSASQLQVVTPAKAGYGLTPIKVANPDNTNVSRSDLFGFYADLLDFTGLPFQATGDYSNANGFVFGLFDPATTLGSAVAQTNRDQIRVLSVTGTETKDLDFKMPVGSKPVGIAAADFNKDGKLDVVVTTQGDSMATILLNDGKGNLSKGGGVSLGAAGINPDAVVTADFDGDGNADVAVANRAGNSLSILMGDGQGGFRMPIANVPEVNDPASLSVGDLNGDGAPDLAVANYSEGAVSILFNDFGNFSGKGRFKTNSLMIGLGINSVKVTDINNDGRLDMLAAASMNNKVVAIENNGIPNIFKYDIPTEANPRAVQTGDLNGDGFPDLVVPCKDTNKADLFMNNAGKGFNRVVYSSVDAQCMRPVQAAIYDLDRDGRLDIGMLCEVGLGLLINHSGL